MCLLREHQSWHILKTEALLKCKSGVLSCTSLLPLFLINISYLPLFQTNRIIRKFFLALIQRVQGLEFLLSFSSILHFLRLQKNRLKLFQKNLYLGGMTTKFNEPENSLIHKEKIFSNNFSSIFTSQFFSEWWDLLTIKQIIKAELI